MLFHKVWWNTILLFGKLGFSHIGAWLNFHFGDKAKHNHGKIFKVNLSSQEQVFYRSTCLKEIKFDDVANIEDLALKEIDLKRNSLFSNMPWLVIPRAFCLMNFPWDSQVFQKWCYYNKWWNPWRRGKKHPWKTLSNTPS